MSVEITYRCSGCDAIASARPKVEFRVIKPGRQLDLVEVRTPTIETAAPEGWVPFDPYTGVTYCPACWASIEQPAAAPAESHA